MKDEGWWGGVRMGGYHPDNFALLATYKLIKHFNTYHVSELCGVFFIMLSFLGIENRPFFLLFHKCHLPFQKFGNYYYYYILDAQKGGGLNVMFREMAEECSCSETKFKASCYLWVIPPVCKVQDSSTLCLLRRRLE
jgi:hypothetical protein